MQLLLLLLLKMLGLARHGRQSILHSNYDLFLLCILSIFTFTSTGKVTFRWKSYATIYAIFFYIAMTVVVYYVGRERIRILGETKKFDEKIYAYIFVIFLVPHFWIPFVGWGKIDHFKCVFFACDYICDAEKQLIERNRVV